MISISDIQRAAALLNIQELARLSDIPYARLYAKITRGSELKESEIKAIDAALSSKGISLSGNQTEVL